jgi:hypothetical protein
MTIPHAIMKIPFGTIRSGDAISFSFEVNGASGHFKIFAMHRDGRKANILMRLGHREFIELKSIIAKADESIHSLVESGVLKRPWNVS